MRPAVEDKGQASLSPPAGPKYPDENGCVRERTHPFSGGKQERGASELLRY